MNATTSPPSPEPEALDGAPRLALPGRGNSPGAGWEWIAGGWRLFVRAPLMWIIAVILVFIGMIALSFIPILGSIAVQLLQPVIIGGFMVACHSLEGGGPFELDHLFAGFRKNFGSLLVVGLLFMIFGLLILMVFAAFVVFSIGAAAISFNPDQIINAIGASTLTLLVGLLVTMALLVPLAAAYWFAPPLVIMHGLSPIDAMRESFFGAFRNFVAFIVYGIVVFFFAIVAMIPFGLGFLVLVPVLMASIYVGYRMIFTEDAGETAPAPTL